MFHKYLNRKRRRTINVPQSVPNSSSIAFKYPATVKSDLPSLKQLCENINGSLTLQKYTYHQLQNYGLRDDVININSVNALDFTFPTTSPSNSPLKPRRLSFSTPCKTKPVPKTMEKGWEHIQQDMISHGCDPKFLTEKWMTNHYRWIIWKLASIERCFPYQYSNRYCTYEHALQQFKHRYEIDINSAKPSVIKRIFRGDSSPAVFMILTVSKILHKHITSGNSKENEIPLHSQKSRSTICLTDNWYEIICSLDNALEVLVHKKKIKIGDKLRICLARKDGDACEPLEGKSSEVRLILNINYVRRALWYSNLGLQPIICASLKLNLFRVNLRSIRIGGGLIPYIYICVERRYATQYLINNKIHNKCAETTASQTYFKLLEKKEFEYREQIARDMNLYAWMFEGADISNAIKMDEDCNEREIEHAVQQKKVEFKERVRNAIENDCELQYEIVPFFVCKIREVHPEGYLTEDCTEITCWQQSISPQAMMHGRNETNDVLKEGNYIRIYRSNASNRLYNNGNFNFTQIKSCRSTIYEKYEMENIPENILERNFVCYIKRKFCDFIDIEDAESAECMVNKELDVVGYVLYYTTSADTTVNLSANKNVYGENAEHEQLFVLNIFGDNYCLVHLDIRQSKNIIHQLKIKNKFDLNCEVNGDLDVVLIRNLIYNAYDGKWDIHNLQTTQRTSFCFENGRKNVELEGVLRDAKKFIQSKEGANTLQKMRKKLKQVLCV